MDVVTDPETYENSEIVEKSSKSGIFSNKRLLVIKNGFLYYFTNVPKNYKTHLPNILNTFKELPKSSIEIKEIQQVKMENSKSTNLLIKFHEKDMIDREDIRKSISSKNYVHSKKGSEDLQEWKFTFSTALQCRIWFNALLKLKTHFSKQNKSIQLFFNNFDPSKKNTQLPAELKSIFAGKKPQTNETNIVKQFQQQDKKKEETIKKQQPQKKPPSILPMMLPVQEEKKEQKPIKKEQKKQEKKQPKKEQKKQPKRQEKRQQKREERKMEKEMQKKESALDVIEEDQEIKNKKIEEEIRQELQEQIRTQEHQKVESLMRTMKQELSEKQNKINRLQEDLRYMEQTQFRFKTKELDSFKKSIELNQFSVQTDEEEEEPSYIPFKLTNSYAEDFNSTQRDTFNILRNTGSLSFQLSQTEKNYDHYDYYTEIGTLFDKSLNFGQQIKKEIKLINYVDKMKKIAMETVKQYIDTNKPQSSLSFQGSLFQTKIVCSHGKIVNLNGFQKLVYSNKEHQKLKHQFKLYNYIQSKFLQTSKKKHNFSLRVPLCYLLQYKGYTALLKYLPYLQQIQPQEQQKGKKQLKKIVGVQFVDSYSFKKIGNRQQDLFLVTNEHSYKLPTSNKMDINNNETIYGPSIVDQWRLKGVSSHSLNIERDIEILQQNLTPANLKKIINLKHILLCRNIKNLYRSIEPYSDNEYPSTFFQAFITNPSQILSLLSDHLEYKDDGLFISYLEYFFGVKVPQNFDIHKKNAFDFQQMEIEPVIRSFPLENLRPIKMLLGLNKYIEEEKYSMADSALEMLNQLSGYHRERKILGLKYSLKKYQTDKQILAKTGQRLIKFKKSLEKHDPMIFQCCLLIIDCFSRLGDLNLVLNEIYFGIDYIEYMYGSASEGEEQEYLSLLAAETLAKMGKFKESTIIYQKLLDNSLTLTPQQISLSFAEIYTKSHSIEYRDLLQFLLSLIEWPNQMKTGWQAKMKMHIGLIYERMGNRDQALQYFQDALDFYVVNGIKDRYQIDCFFKIACRLIELYHSRKDKETVYNKFQDALDNCDEKLQNYSDTIRIDFRTFTFCSIIKTETNADHRRLLSEVMETMREKEKTDKILHHKLSFDNLASTIHMLIGNEELGARESRVIEQIKVPQVQTFLLSV